jgi:hypothetical protein
MLHGYHTRLIVGNGVLRGQPSLLLLRSLSCSVRLSLPRETALCLRPYLSEALSKAPPPNVKVFHISSGESLTRIQDPIPQRYLQRSQLGSFIVQIYR